MKRQSEEWAIQHLQKIMDLEKRDGDALPGSVIKLVRRAIVIMRKRRKNVRYT